VINVDTVLLFVVYVLMSVVIQPSWLPNPIKVIIIIISDNVKDFRSEDKNLWLEDKD